MRSRMPTARQRPESLRAERRKRRRLSRQQVRQSDRRRPVPSDSSVHCSRTCLGQLAHLSDDARRASCAPSRRDQSTMQSCLLPPRVLTGGSDRHGVHCKRAAYIGATPHQSRAALPLGGSGPARASVRPVADAALGNVKRPKPYSVSCASELSESNPTSRH